MLNRPASTTFAIVLSAVAVAGCSSSDSKSTPRQTPSASTSGVDQPINIRIAVAQEERRKLSRRTKDGLATAARKGVRLGKPRQVPAKVERQIVRMHVEGLTPYNIAKWLDAQKVPTPQGGAS